MPSGYASLSGSICVSAMPSGYAGLSGSICVSAMPSGYAILSGSDLAHKSQRTVVPSS